MQLEPLMNELQQSGSMPMFHRLQLEFGQTTRCSNVLTATKQDMMSVHVSNLMVSRIGGMRSLREEAEDVMVLVVGEDTVVLCLAQITLRVYSTQPVGIPKFTPEQWSSLAQLVKNQKLGSDAKLSGKKEQLSLVCKASRFNVIIDSGASHHMTGDLNLLTNICSIAPCPIKLPDGGVTWASRLRTLNLGGKFVLHNVFFAPNLDITLISMAQLLRQLADFVVFTRCFCVI